MFNRFVPSLLIVFIMFVGAAPVVSSALSTDDLQTQIQQLLAQVQELMKQLSDLRAQIAQTRPSVATSTPAVPPFATPYRICSVAYRSLATGHTGDDVQDLQEFLKGEGFLHVDPTGYFGPLTRDAVAKWQATQGVVSSDNAAVSGAGIFGPKSREFLRRHCQGGVSSSERFNATPTHGDAPLTVTFSTWLSGFHPTSISYTIDFGDGTSEPAASCPAPADACTGPGTNTHTYAADGSYTATLAKIIDPCVGQPACRAAVQRQVVARQVIRVGTIACTEEYMPVCGAKPIVCVTTPCDPIPTTYSNKCMMAADNASFLYSGQCRDTATDPQNDPTCRSWYDGCNTCSRSTPGGAAMCTLRACMMTAENSSMAAPYCTSHFNDTSADNTPVIKEISGPVSIHVGEMGTWRIQASDPQNDPLSYSVTWGDEGASSNAAELTNSVTTNSFTQSTSFTHSYSAAGTYTIVVIVHDPAGNEARSSITVQVTQVPVACTLQYDPVCGRPAGCSNTCPSGLFCAAICRIPDPVTYSNKCFMQAAGASLISEGVCDVTQ